MRRRSIALLVLVFIVASIASMGFLHPYIYATFIKLERNESAKRWKQAERTLARNVSSLETFARDWATWDDMYSFVEAPSPAFIASSLADTSFNNYRLAFLAVFDTSRKLVWGQGWDPELKTGTPFEKFLPGFEGQFSYLFNMNKKKGGFSDIVPTAHGLLMVATLPILRSDGQGPAIGYLVMARSIDRVVVSELAEHFGFEATIAGSFDPKLDPLWPKIRTSLVTNSGPYVDAPAVGEQLSVYGPIRNSLGITVCYLKITMNRPILDVGRKALLLSILSTVFGSLALFATMLLAFGILGKAQRELEDSERRFRALAESTDDPILRMDAASRYQYANPAAMRLFGISDMASLGKPLTQAGLPQGLVTALEPYIQTAISGGLTRHIEQQTVPGTWYDWILAPERGSGGNLRGLILSGHDISDIVRASLELREAKELSDEASSMKSRFVSNVSHEIRTPLNGIIGFAELVLSASSLPEARQRAQVILDESGILLQLINDLLDCAKIESGKLELDPAPTDLRSLVEELRRGSLIKASEKGIEVRVVVAEQVPPLVVADGLRLRQILQNLVTNAVKFTDRGHVTVRIAYVEGDQRTVRLMFAVEDTGIGIPKEKQRHIFESFTQADASTTRKYGGTGLGTTIARDLTQLMGGKLELQSTAGEGSQFWLILSLDRAEAAPLPAQESDITSPKPRLPLSIRGLILVAEDYPINQEIIRTQLENDGHSVELAENGLEAVKAAERRRFDLIFMDIHMPELDGFDATRRIRSTDNPNKGTPIIALTASAERLTREECLCAGMDEVLTKPIRSGPLLAALQDWLGKARRIPRTPSSGAQRVDEANPGTMDAELLQVYDPEVALEQFGGNRQLLEQSLGHLATRLSVQLAAMGSMIREGRTAELRAEAHKIKGGAASVTAMRVSEASGALEAAAKGGEGDLGILLAALEVEVEGFRRRVAGGKE